MNLIDADNDEVPGAAELAGGLNPRRGSDVDGDSFSDLQEMLSDTDPNDAANNFAHLPMG